MCYMLEEQDLVWFKIFPFSFKNSIQGCVLSMAFSFLLSCYGWSMTWLNRYPCIRSQSFCQGPGFVVQEKNSFDIDIECFILDTLNGAGEVNHAFLVWDTVIWKSESLWRFDKCKQGKLVVNCATLDLLQRYCCEHVRFPVHALHTAAIVNLWWCSTGISVWAHTSELESREAVGCEGEDIMKSWKDIQKICHLAIQRAHHSSVHAYW